MPADAASDVIEIRCAECGTRNRVPRDRIQEGPVCGRCKQPVLPRKPVTVTDQTWAEEVEQSPVTVLADFWAPWCGPCRMVAPVLEEIAAERAGKIKVAKVNVDENPRLAARFNVQSIPTLLVLRGPLLLDEIVGALPKAQLTARLARFV